MMRHGAHRRNCRALLSSAHCSRAYENAGVFTPVTAAGPLSAGLVPESLPLGGEVAVAGWDAEQEGVIFLESGGVDRWNRRVLWGGVHLREDVLGEGFRDPKGWDGLSACGFGVQVDVA